MSTNNLSHNLIPIWRRTFLRIVIHIVDSMRLVIGYCYSCSCCILLMLVGINVVMLLLETNHGCHKIILTWPMKFELKQQPMVSMGILKTLSQTRKQKGKYESIPSMNQTNMLEYNELVDGVFQWTPCTLECYSGLRCNF